MRHDNRINLGVKDTGQGINSTILSRLFTKFASKSYEGTGLGLFISKGIIKDNGGRQTACGDIVEKSKPTISKLRFTNITFRNVIGHHRANILEH